jgi:hypothetical protein
MHPLSLDALPFHNKLLTHWRPRLLIG